jgi:transposase
MGVWRMKGQGCRQSAFVNGVFRVLRSGLRRQDLPDRYGKNMSVQKRLMRWAALCL